MNNAAIQEWLKLTGQTRRNIFGETATAIGLPPAAVEKDWWLVRTLELVFETSIAPYTVFKGGTSLSKAWGLIDRFSEDIDLALDRQYLGIEKPDSEMTGSQLSKLRRLTGKFITEKFFPELAEKFSAAGLKVNVQQAEAKSNDQDPLIIEVYYQTLTDPITYLQPRVLIELGSRSLIEPYEERSFTSMVGEKYKGQGFAGENILIPSVNPQRTFLEKIFLLHEEFQLPAEKIRVERKSRHLYDLEKMMDTDYAIAALTNKELYDTIVVHREKLTPLKGIDYGNHTPEKINLIPPDAIIGIWEKDYQIMQESMLFNPSISFEQLILRIKTLKERINAIIR